MTIKSTHQHVRDIKRITFLILLFVIAIFVYLLLQGCVSQKYIEPSYEDTIIYPVGGVYVLTADSCYRER